MTWTDGTRPGVMVCTDQRDPGTSLDAEVYVRERDDVDTGRSLVGTHIRLNSTEVFLSGHETRTLYRLLERAVNG